MITLPNAFNAIAGGRIIGTTFYVGFFCEALSSAIGMAEAVVNTLMELLHCSRGKALSICMAGDIVVGSVSIMSLELFDKMDIFTSNYAVVLGALVISIFVGWIWGIDKAEQTANIENRFLRQWFKVSVKYVCPIAILLIFLGNFVAF